MFWTLREFRRWWLSSARYRWKRAIGVRAGRDLTLFRDVKWLGLSRQAYHGPKRVASPHSGT